MRAARSFTDILAQRGRIVIFTPSASVGLKFEQLAERQHATVITTRGWADRFGPLSTWQRLHDARDFGVLSLCQTRYVTGVKVHCTDLVWVGDMGHPRDMPHLWITFSQCMSRAHETDEARLWTLAEDAL